MKSFSPAIERFAWIFGCVIVWGSYLFGNNSKSDARKKGPLSQMIPATAEMNPPAPGAGTAPGERNDDHRNMTWLPEKALAGMNLRLTSPTGALDTKVLEGLGFSESEIQTCLSLMSNACAGFQAFESKNLRIKDGTAWIRGDMAFWAEARKAFGAAARAALGEERGAGLERGVAMGGFFFGYNVRDDYTLAVKVENGKYNVNFGLPDNRGGITPKVREMTEEQFRTRFGRVLDGLLKP